jgi:hypothetical protein
VAPSSNELTAGLGVLRTLIITIEIPLFDESVERFGGFRSKLGYPSLATRDLAL